jgi:hypothetical protein
MLAVAEQLLQVLLLLLLLLLRSRVTALQEPLPGMPIDSTFKKEVTGGDTLPS